MTKVAALALGVVLLADPASAQFGRVTDALDKAQKVKKISDLAVSAEEERQIGQQVSDRLVEDFGVFQDAKVTKYVALVGTVLAQASPKPDLNWQFVVLDTDGVNAFAAPGGFVHITRGLLGLIKNEAELAGVLAHEVVHITERHTINAIKKNNMVSLGTDEVGASGGMAQSLIAKVAGAAYTSILDNSFSRGDEGESDEKGVQIANKVGYAPSGLTDVLTKLAERNQAAKEPSGLFASHPVIKDRIAKIARTIKDKKLSATATVAARYTSHIAFDVKPVGEIAMVPAGTRGLAGGDGKKEGEAAKKDEPATKEEPAKKEEPKKGGIGGALSSLTGGGKQAQQTQTVASAGARGVNPDRDAVGGPNKSRVKITLAAAEIAEFRKGIA